MLKGVTIRQGRIKDKKHLVSIWKELTDEHIDVAAYDFDMVKEAPEIWMKFYETNVRSRNRKAFIAEKDGEIIGYIMGCILKRPPVYKTTHEARINDIVVTKKWRRKGVGTMLLEAFADWARAKGMKYVTLNVVPENKIGLKFYENLEFETILVNQRKMV